jgi:UDP-N-acetylglucosamine--N-acetylmuramyl-(pentapeptide) pyrophosphoryl-undecaprenol N-acetylglucosamine transferase
MLAEAALLTVAAGDALRATGPRLHAVVLACGGTGGHVYPAIAIARELHARQPHAHVTFVGRPGSFEEDALLREGFEMDALAIGRLAGQGAWAKLRTLGQLPVAVARAAAILARRRPDVVIGTGGFVSGPTMLAAVMRRLPTLVQEQNALPGLTNQGLRLLVDRVALAHAPAGRPLAPPRHVVTGNPVRPGFFAVPDYEPRSPFRVLVLGGSQGARSLNRAAVDAAATLAREGRPVAFTVQCGPRWEEETRARARESGAPVEIQPFLHDVPARLAAASLVVCRAGASTVAELCAAGRPSVLVPFPHAAGDHQTANAGALVAARAAEMIRDAELTGEALAEVVRRGIAQPDALVRRAGAALALARPDAAARIADLAEQAVLARARRRA